MEAHEQVIPGAVAPTVARSLRNGASYRTVKVFYEPDELEKQMAALGWSITVHPVGWRFFYAEGARTKKSS